MKFITNRLSAILPVLMMVAILGSSALFANAQTVSYTNPTTGRTTTPLVLFAKTQEVLDFQSPKCGGYPVGITTGTGYSTALGQTTIALTDCPNIAVGPPFVFKNGEFTLTTANGDKLFGVYNGQLDATPTTQQDNIFQVFALFTVKGGTGRFEGSTGVGHVVGTQSLTDLKGDFVFVGTVYTPKKK